MLTQEQMWHKKNVTKEKRDLNLEKIMLLKIKEGIIQVSMNTNTWTINAPEIENVS